MRKGRDQVARHTANRCSSPNGAATSAAASLETKAIAEYRRLFQPVALCGQAARAQCRAVCPAPLFAGAAPVAPTADLMVRFALHDVVAARRYSRVRGSGSATGVLITDNCHEPSGDGQELIPRRERRKVTSEHKNRLGHCPHFFWANGKEHIEKIEQTWYEVHELRRIPEVESILATNRMYLSRIPAIMIKYNVRHCPAYRRRILHG